MLRDNERQNFLFFCKANFRWVNLTSEVIFFYEIVRVTSSANKCANLRIKNGHKLITDFSIYECLHLTGPEVNFAFDV